MKVRKAVITVVLAIVAACIIAAVVLLDWVRYKPTDHMRFFSDHQQELTEYAEKFLDQDRIQDITRYKDPRGVRYNIKAETGDDNAYFSFIVPYNEAPFWKSADMTKLKDHLKEQSAAKTLDQYLHLHEIPREDFLEWRAFLAKYDFSMFGIRREDSLVYIAVVPDRGFMYRRDDIADFGYGPKYRKTLNDHWAYYDERGIDADSTD